MLKGYEYRLYPNQKQQTLLDKNFGCVRWVYNWALEQRQKHYQETGRTIKKNELQAQLPVLKRATETCWLGEVNAQSLQAALAHLDAAYVAFFRKESGFPNFKSKYHKQSFLCPQRSDANFERNEVLIPKHGWIKARISRKFEGQVRSTTVKRTPSGKYFASVLVEDGKERPALKSITPNRTVGIDLGLINFITTSDGLKIAAPKTFRKAERRLAFHQRKLSRKVFGSANRNKARIRVALCHEGVTNRRKDFIHKLTRNLVNENQVDCYALETLGIAGMQQNRRLSKSIGDAGWGEFGRQLEYKMKWAGKQVIRIGQFEPSSRLCTCGKRNSELKMSDHTWTCSSCGTTHDRDVLAAQNIRRFALHPQNFLGAGSPELAIT
jgi:putative transposase